MLFISNLKYYLQTLVIYPIKLLISNSSIFIYTAIFILLDRYFDFYNEITKPSLSSWDYWLYKKLFDVILSKVNLKILLIAILIYLLKSFVITFCAFDLLKMFSYARKNIFESFFSFRLKYVIRFFILETNIYLLFGIIASIFYFAFKYLWINFNISTYLFLLIFFVLIYPFFYMSMSIAGFLSVLPLDTINILKKTKRLLKISTALNLYLFYGMRSLIEISTLTLVPYLVLTNFHNIILSGSLIAISLSIPNVILKGSSFSYKIHLFRDDKNIGIIFAKHFLK